MYSKYSNLTQDLIKQYFYYDPETGIFTRKIAKAKRSKVGEVAGGKNENGDITFHYTNELMVKDLERIH